MTASARPDLLAAIVAATVRRVADAKAERPLADVEREAASRTPSGTAFTSGLMRTGRVNVIAECKRRSPSRGVLAPHYDPVAIARTYAAAGAAAISVLTEPAFFDGDLAHLAAVRDAVNVPLLRKDFIVDAYQLVEARAAGADAVLLIVAALDDTTLRRLHADATALGLAVLVEVHDAAELARALACGARIVGVNNRNLRTLEVDVRASHEVAALMPADVVAVSESGLRSTGELAALQGEGYRAFLIGERLMTSPDPAGALAALVEGRAVPEGRMDAPR
ncbi:MAG: indole-3-glycerol phosphate synthase TrpC [Vicinamibacterales bacterium]|nr:indole-3-glycerol phosphate synthase TrpC [Vicinamibacterales bacterium]